MKPAAVRTVFAMFVFALVSFSANAASDDLIQLRQFDEVYFKDGSVERGSLIETDKPDEMKIKNNRTYATRLFNTSEVKEIKRAARPETEVNRLAAQYAGRPDMILKLAKEAMRRFNGPVPVVIGMLEKEAGSNQADLVGYLCELYLQTQQIGSAQKAADRLVSAAPNQGRSYMLRGQVNRALNKLDAAGADFDKAMQLSPDNQDVVVARADFLLSSGKSDAAKSMFTDALAKNPRNVSALLGQGMVLLRQGEFADAEKSFKDVLAIELRHKQAQIGIAACKLMTKQYDEAYQEARSVLNIDNKSWEGYALQAFSKFYAGDRDSLTAFFGEAKNAFDGNPNQPRLLLASSVALDRQARYLEADGATDSLDQARKKRDEANAKFNEVIAADPQDSYIQFLIGERKFQLGDYAAAETSFQKAARLAPNYAPVHGALGTVSLRLGKWEAAKESFTKAISLAAKDDPMLAEYNAGKGLALLKVKLFEDASEAFKQARELDKRNATALCGLGYIANASANKDSAIEFFQQALAADGTCDYAAQALKKIFAQENMSLEYLTFNDGTMPATWKMRPGGMVKPIFANGQVLFTGTQGSTAGSKIEIFRDVKAEEFVRLEADLVMAPTSPVTFGLRLGSATNAVTSFEMEFAKDDSNEIKVRFRDYGGTQQNWQSLKTEWSPEGRVRLGIDTDDFTSGKVRLWVNGKRSAELKLVLQKPGRIVCGIYVQPPPKEVVTAAVDNVVLVTRGAPKTEEGSDALTIIKDDSKKPAPENKDNAPK